MQIKTTGELRGFLADIMVGIRDGTVDEDQANAISKVAGQINQSLAVEVKAAIEMQRLGKDGQLAGSMQIASNSPALAASNAETWCEQCEKLVTPEKAGACGDRFCKARGETA